MIDDIELLLLYNKKRKQKIFLITIFVIIFIFLCILGFLNFYKYADTNYFQPKIVLNKTDYEYRNNSFVIKSSESCNVKTEDLIKSYNKKYFEMKIDNGKKTKKCIEGLKKGIPGSYDLKIIFTNNFYTENKTLVINIYDDISPTLELSKENIEVNINDIIDYKSYIIKAEDNIDKLSIADVIYNEIDTSISGNYTLNYVLQDKAGNETSKDINVTVVQPVSNNITNQSAEKQQKNDESKTAVPSEKKEDVAENKFFSGNSIEAYNQALEYAEKNSKKGYEVRPTGEGFQVILY